MGELICSCFCGFLCFSHFFGPIQRPMAPETAVLSRTDLVKLQKIVGHADQSPLASYFFDPT
jgi:hypothetical protein